MTYDDFQRDIHGVLWLSLAIFLGVSLFSYHPSDPSMFFWTKADINNLFGFLGSNVSYILYKMFGLFAWVFVFMAGNLSYQTFKSQDWGFGLKQIFLYLILSVILCSLSQAHFMDSIFYKNIVVGGVIGNFVVNFLIKTLNWWGLVISLWTCLFIVTLGLTQKSLKDLSEIIYKNIKFIFSKKFLRAIFFPLQIIKVIFLFVLLKLRALWKTGSSQISFLSLKDRKKIKDNQNEEYEDEEYEDEEYEDEYEDEEEDECEEDEEYEEGGNYSEDDIEKKQKLKSEKKIKTRATKKKRKVKMKVSIKRKLGHWTLPKISILSDPPLTRERVTPQEIEEKSALLKQKLEQFNVSGEIVNAFPGPAVTLFEFKPDINVRVSRITDLADDLSLALSSESVRIIAPIPGRNVVGIETSNLTRETVYLKDIIADKKFWTEDCYLPVSLGQDVGGFSNIVDLRKIPHMLVAGSTGSGKSVFTVSVLCSFIFRHTPDSLRLILVDPKQVDLAIFDNIPHLLTPVIRDPKKAVRVLNWAIKEMEKRYRSMSQFNARGLEAFNSHVKKFSEKQILEHFQFNQDCPKRESYYYEEQPYIAIIVEEFADLMAVDKSNVEQAVVRLAQMARACGIHLILAMQSPRKDVVTGLIKTNIPGRASFKVASKTDSRIILDEGGAERLLTRGDMLFLAPGISKPKRYHGPWLPDEDITDLINFWKGQGDPLYDEQAMQFLNGQSEERNNSASSFDNDDKDERYDEILEAVSEMKIVSASLLQRKFRLGYPRAARMIELFEQAGIVGPPQGSKPRQVLANNPEAEV
ncbi:MAG: DNA translocase FtsK [Bdellovibrionales bacterium]|nr:DNA translocase FtsK [Bdellovibrionales bacterium]